MTTIKTTHTFSNIDDALAANAAIVGRGMFDHLADSELRMTKRVNESMGVKEYMMAENGDIFYVCHYEGERILNKLTTFGMLSDGYISLGKIVDGEIRLELTEVCHKSDRKVRQTWCRINPDFVMVEARLFN